MDRRLDRAIFSMDGPGVWNSQRMGQECCCGWFMISM
jgi:hypothetical protein